MVEKFKQEIEMAIEEYGVDHIDIIKDEEDDIIYGAYHSSKNSFSVTEAYAIDIMDDNEIEAYADKLGISHSI